MKLATVIITLLAMTVCLLAAPTLIIPPPVSQLTTVEIAWTACPTSPQDVISETIWLDTLSFGVAGTGRTVTVLDKAGSPASVLTAVSLTANQTTVVQIWGSRFAGGITLSCSGAGVVYQFRGKVKR